MKAMSQGQTQVKENGAAAFILSLLAGLWMLSAGAMMGRFGYGGMMAGHYGYFPHMGGWMWGSGMHAFGMSRPWLGVAAGIVVLVGAVMLYLRPEQRRAWGFVILLISALDIFAGMGGILAGALGVIGGALAIAGNL
ncbi:MAG TPA: hypothetical protein VJS43_17825 [Candidatus Acidoferrales bacterium]|nr:hypothetical protein [Candidatus Acidoferrales bacterium]